MKSKILNFVLCFAVLIGFGFAAKAEFVLPSSVTIDQSELVTCADGQEWTGCAPSNTPSVAGLLQISDLTYLGGFRVPGTQNGPSPNDQFFYQNKFVIAMNNTTGNMLGTGLGEANTRNVCEFSIPSTLSTSLTLTDLPLATHTQTCVNLIDQLPFLPPDTDDDQNGITIYGMYEQNNNLLFNFARFYDPSDGGANITNNEVVGIHANASNLSASGQVSGAFQYTAENRAPGWISPIPSNWQAQLGGTHISGFTSGASVSIISRLSAGPSAHVFDIDDILNPVPANGSVVTTTAAMDFPLPNIMGNTGAADVDAVMSASGSIWNFISSTLYCAIIPNTDTYACFGFDGGYFSGNSYKLRDNTTGVDTGDFDAIDANDYRNTYYFFDVNDFVLALNGQINPYDIVPYAWGEFNPPFGGSQQTLKRISGAVFDPATNRFYVSLLYADTSQGQISPQPLVLAFTFGSGT